MTIKTGILRGPWIIYCLGSLRDSRLKGKGMAIPGAWETRAKGTRGEALGTKFPFERRPRGQLFTHRGAQKIRRGQKPQDLAPWLMRAFFYKKNIVSWISSSLKFFFEGLLESCLQENHRLSLLSACCTIWTTRVVVKRVRRVYAKTHAHTFVFLS